MLMPYLIILWIILTVAFNYRRKSGTIFLCWFLVTVIALWPFIKWAAPVVQGAYNSVPVQAVAQEFRAELNAELRKELGEFYK